MEFPYIKAQGAGGNIYRPCLPITFGYGQKEFPVGSALVDTGADFTILPLEIAELLEIELDDTTPLQLSSAGGGAFTVKRSQKKVRYTLEKQGYRAIHWEGKVYFAKGEPIVLLGHQQCLEYFDLTFMGPEKKLSVLPRFRT